MSTTDGPSGTPGDDESDIVEELNSFLTRAQSRVTGLKAKQAELDLLVQFPETSAVNAVFDDRGFLLSLVIDAEAGAALDAVGLVQEINLALARAERQSPDAPATASGDAEEAAGLIETIFAGLTSGLSSEPQLYRNDLATVTVTTMWGEVLSVECATAWVESSKPSVISEEIVRVVNLAVRADDPLNRRKD